MDVACDSVAPTLPSASKKLKHTQVDLVSNPRNSSGMAGYFDPLKSISKSDSMELMNKDASSSDFSSTNYGDAKDLDDSSDYDDEDDDEDIYDYDYDFDEYSLLQSQFDNVDLPSGVEASVPWFSAPETEKKETATSSSMMNAESSSNNMTGNENDNSTPGISQISQFDVVADFSDHYYANSKFSDVKPNKNWAKKIQDEWKILKENLPEKIFVRVYGERMELLRAVIVGPSGTPYHDGLFVFDCLFPDNYPSSPPSVHYHSGGLRINPNLYHCGKVCLSLLGTWRGKNEENWIPDGSTMLQVLVSIQALILNSRPFFNEPGFESYTGAVGEQRSKKYNQDVFIKSLKTMIYTLKRPPMHFEELVGIHFRCRGRDIMLACRAYVMGAEVGSNFKDKEKNKDDKESCSKEFKSSVGNMMTLLLTSLSRNGMPGWEQFRPNLFLNEDKIDEE